MSTQRQIKAWTDGACSQNPGPGGWAWVAIDGEKKYKASGYSQNTTNNIMELQAVLELVKFPLFTNCQITVHTDSQGVINWLSRTWKRNAPGVVSSCALIESWVESQNITLSFVKVKGHSNDPMNDLVDQMAVMEYKQR